MKKVIFTLILTVATMVAVNAQDILKAQNGAIISEVTFTPWGNTPIGLPMEGLRGRFFLSDNFVLRVGFNMNYTHHKENPINAQGGNDELKQNAFLLGIFPGIEIHIGHMKRLSPYLGAELGVSFKSAKATYTSNLTSGVFTTTLNGATDTLGSTPQNRAFTMIGVNILAGADYYFTEHVYIGVEMGIGLGSTSWKEVTVDRTGLKTVTLANKSNDLWAGVNYQETFRLGYRFK